MEHISFSQINMYSRCGLQYYFRYIKGLIVPPTTSLVLGKSFHRGVEKNYKHKMEKGEDLPLEALLDLYSDEIEKEFQQEILFDEEETFKGKEKVKGEIKDCGVAMLKKYRQDVAPQVKPLGVEETFFLDIDGVDVPVMGVIDLITPEGVVDHKTAKRLPSKEAANRSQQLTVYACGYQKLFGSLPEKLSLHYITYPAGKKGEVKTAKLDTTRTGEDVERFLRRLLRILDGIRKGVFIPPPQDSWACSYCGYRRLGICKEYLY